MRCKNLVAYRRDLPYTAGCREAKAEIPSKFVSILLVSLALLGPCLWHPSIGAGDLPSHLYNAWLANLIEQGHAPGLWIARQWTNVMFDLALSWLMRTFGMAIGERMAVGAAVLVFFWGAFAFVCTVTQKRPWFIAPCVGVLAYGWVFQEGFFDFYLSAGVSFVVLALLWRGTLKNRIVASPLVALAWLAHPLPVVWLLAVVTYVWIARKLLPEFQALSFLLSIAAMILLRQFLLGHFRTGWSKRQLLFVTGADQVWVFGRQYWLIGVMILVLWVIILWQSRSFRDLWQIPLQIYLLTAAGIAILPYAIKLSWYQEVLTITERMSLFSGVLASTVVATAEPKRWHRVSFCLASVIYFCFWYADAQVFERLESKIKSLINQVPSEQRILTLPPLVLDHGYEHANAIANVEHKAESFFMLSDVGRLLYLINPRIHLDHIADTVCISRCFSYGNYEPSSAAFRIRAFPGNRIVVATHEDLQAMGNGTYVIKESDLPIYQIYYCGRGFTDICIRALSVGETNGSVANGTGFGRVYP